MPVIYLLTNVQNGKRYVGKTVRSLEIRWQGHLGSARRGDTDMLVCRAIKKHGVQAFERSVIEECDETQLGARETHWIRELHTHVSEGGYNLTFGGDGGLPGYRFSKESKEKIRQKALGRKLSPESRAKISVAHSGKPKSPEAVEARARSNRGKKRTEEQKARISQGLKGHVVTAETRRRISTASKDKTTSEVMKQKLGKIVEQLSLDGSVIAIHPSLSAAAQIAGLSKGAMSGIIRSDRVVANSRWRYENRGRNGDV